MAKNGYVIFLVTANVRGRRKETRPLDDLGGNGESLVHAAAEVAEHRKGEGIRRIDRYEQAHEITGWWGQGGGLLIEAGAGPFGTPGRAVDVDNGLVTPYSERHALVTDLRAYLAVAPQGHIGALVVERRSARHLKDVVQKAILGPVAVKYGLTVNVDPHVDRKAWEHYIGNAQAYGVTAVWRSKKREDYLPETSSYPELKMTATHGMAQRIGNRVMGTLASKARGEPDRAPIVIRELTPPDRDDYEPARIEVAVDDDGTRRTVVIEREELPQWVYETDSRRMFRVPMLNLFREEAGRVLTEVGPSLPQDWGTVPWPADASGRLEVMAGVAPPTGGPPGA